MQHPLPAQITQIKTMSKFVRLTVDTQETLTPDQKSELFDLYERVGYFFFLDKPETTIRIDDLPEMNLEDGEKSPSQRLRAVLYIWWQHKTDQTQDFELFYRRWMERTIDKVKEQLT